METEIKNSTVTNKSESDLVTIGRGEYNNLLKSHFELRKLQAIAESLAASDNASYTICDSIYMYLFCMTLDEFKEQIDVANKACVKQIEEGSSCNG